MNKPTDKKETPEAASAASENGTIKKEKKHLIRPKWLRVVLRVFLCLIIFILMIPVLLYVPPVQTFIKNIA